MPLPQQQQRTYNYIVEHFQTEQRMPTIREIMKAIGVKSPCPVQHHLAQLIKAGYLAAPEGKARSLKLLKYRITLSPVEAA